MTTWNNRVIVSTLNEGTGYDEIIKGVYEVFYNDDGNITMWSEFPSSLIVYEGETFTEMMKRMEVAIGRTWLTITKDENGNEILVEYKGEK